MTHQVHPGWRWAPDRSQKNVADDHALMGRYVADPANGSVPLRLHVYLSSQTESLPRLLARVATAIAEHIERHPLSPAAHIDGFTADCSTGTVVVITMIPDGSTGVEQEKAIRDIIGPEPAALPQPASVMTAGQVRDYYGLNTKDVEPIR